MPETIGGLVFPIKIPLYSDNADIQAAIKYYHYGSPTVPLTESAIETTSIAGYLKAIDTRLDAIASSEIVILAGSENLDNKLTTGKYLQDSNTDAESGTNYPIYLTKKWAGVLTVAFYNNTVFQFYEGQAGTNGVIASPGFIAWRSKTSGGTWSSWIFAADASHIHDDRYYTESEIDSKLVEKQAVITGAATTIDTENLTVSRALASDASGKVSVSVTTLDELAYVSGATSSIQTQLTNRYTKTETDTALANKVSSTSDTIFVQSGTPSGAVTGDLWFW
jgi:hypothetical protein